MTRLERLLLYPLLGALVWAVFGDAFPVRSADAADKNARFARVQAQRFEVVDKKGKVVAVLGANETGGGALIVLTANERPVLELGVRREAGVITMMRDAGGPKPMLQIAADREGRGQLALFGDDPKTAAVLLGRDANGGKLALRSKAGAPAAGLNVTPSGTGFCAVTAEDGRARAFLGVGPKGGVAGVKDTNDNVVVLLHMGGKKGEVTLFDPTEKK